MPGTTSNSPSLVSSWPWRHRLGFAVSGAGAVEERVGVEVPHHPAVGRADLTVIAARDETALGVGEVLRVVHRQALSGRREGAASGVRCFLGHLLIMPRLGPGSLVQRRRRDRSAHRHDLEHPGGHVRGPLPGEVPRQVGEAAVGVGEARRDAGPLAQSHERQEQRRDQQRGDGGEQRQLRSWQGLGTSPRSARVATSCQPNGAAAAEVRMTATTSPIGPAGGR